ncbi:response regulator [Seonamhaeicola algicola]|uniref:Response regulator n=1 Tax=Seonamhaeicola algicola TaxID=1719036 RepID=A0A5C7AYT3_9FLAO|nr:chemotaxis protein CheB [Seonamhaeicola algicola]TXE12823.1 response regulator [Seonamhaeicola algicola]
MKSKNSNFYVVGIGASAGGLDAIQTLFDHIPNDTGMAFIIIQHLSPDFKSLMPELLSKHTNMPIFTAEDKQTIKPNAIYLNQRNKNLHIKGNKLYLLNKGPKQSLNLPIDIFFHTLGEEFKEKAIGVILSGTGSDGSRGIKTIKEGNGTTIVQDPTTTQFDGMPNSAIHTNAIDYVLSPRKIAELFQKQTIDKQIITKEFHKSKSNESIVNDILTIIYRHSGIDFREYKRNTLLRRLEKRMNINNIEQLFDYASFIAGNEEEKRILKEDFLIGVTRFFRDSEAFKILKENVIPDICKNKPEHETVRVWVAGCSTGEEVYSIAILLDDYIRTNQLKIDYKIFATDIDTKALAIAGIGSYHINIINEIEQKYLENYFLKTGDKIRILKRIRERIVFSNHNLIKDPPFIRMDLISCRNLLIYLDNKIQNKVTNSFQFALNKSGYLFLGNSESLGDIAKYFKPVDVKWKIYQNVSENKKFSPSKNNLSERISTYAYKTPTKITEPAKYISSPEAPDVVFHKYLSKKFSPSAIFIDGSYNILFIKGDAGKKLSHQEGVFQNNLLKIVNPEIASIIRSGIRRLKTEKKDIIIKDVINEVNGNNYTFNLTFHIPNDKFNLQDCYLIEFSEEVEINHNNPLLISNITADEISNHRLEDLENELAIVKTELQNTVEELETSNEELQSSNEELMASNEELQSTNEELQSVNEELYTVNSELQEKNKELTNLSNDVTNLLDNTDIGTLFLDTDLRIRKFTPELTDVFNLRESDYGRTLSSFTSNFDETIRNQIIEDSKLVLSKLITIEKQVQDKDNNFYLKRISPFITTTKTIDGVVITFNNINKLKETEKELAQTDLKYQMLFENLTEGFFHCRIITDNKGTPIDWEYITVNPAYKKITGIKVADVKGKKVSEFFPQLVNEPNKWIQNYAEIAFSGEKRTIEGNVNALGKYFVVNAFSPRRGEFAGTISDLTAVKRSEIELRKSTEELKRIQEITQIGSWYLNLNTDEVTWTIELYKIFDCDPNLPAPTFTESRDFFTDESWKILENAVAETTKTGIPYEIELNIITKKGHKRWLWARGETVLDDDGNVIGLRGAAQNITDQKTTETELIKAKKVAELANAHKSHFLANMSHEIRTPMNGVLGFSELLKNDQLSTNDRLKYLEIIDNNSKQLLNLIDDIIDIAKIESNEIKIVTKECHLPKLINNLEITYNQLKRTRYKKEVTFKSYIPEQHKDLIILTDPQRLQQILSNLLNNALKFSNKGEISFGFTVEKNNINFFVKDQGIGIQKSKQMEIFERFKQVNYNDNANYGGTGLGLAICKGLVTLLGGDITVNSEFNVGTTFKFYIPLKVGKILPDKKEAVDFETVKSLNGKTILIAEDDSLIRLLFKIVLKNTGANLLFANNGKAAVKAHKENPKIDISLLDIRMPQMNGIDALDEIIKINPKAKVIMQSAYVMPEEKEKCYSKGCVGFLTKPVVKEELFELLNKWAN